ncbi:hypothetical protein [Yoonia sp.]|uniref:hypothetical protein n=1 Tax=Yoonia sp. TaxID=2212373 RepID=UPI0040478035
MLIVERDIAQGRLLRVFPTLDVMASQDAFVPAIEPPDHASCLWSHWWREMTLDAEINSKQIELMLSRGRALAQAKQPVGESLAVVGQYPSDVDVSSRQNILTSFVSMPLIQL